MQSALLDLFDGDTRHRRECDCARDEPGSAEPGTVECPAEFPVQDRLAGGRRQREPSGQLLRAAQQPVPAAQTCLRSGVPQSGRELDQSVQDWTLPTRCPGAGESTISTTSAREC